MTATAARPEPWVIWSFEHDAWWAPGRCGYVLELAQAGRYTEAEARDIEAHANIIRQNEVALSLPEAQMQCAPRLGVAWLIKAGARPVPFAPADRRARFSLKDLQTAVGGYIEVVRAPNIGDGTPMFLVVNEDGKRLELPRNPFATRLYHAAGGLTDDVIVGDVVLASHSQMNGDDEEEA